MNNNQFKSVAYAAKTRLSQSGFDVRSGHIHEIIAALHGYQSNAAFLADASQSSNLMTSTPDVILLDMQVASNRVKTLLPGIGGRKAPRADDDKAQRDAAHAIARDVSECLEAASVAGQIFLRPMYISCENTALAAYAKTIALTDPILAGVVDDPDARYRDAINEGFSEEMANFQAKHLGPLKFPFGSCGVVDGRLHIELSDEYFPVEGEGGVVRVYIEGTQRWRSTYVINSVRAEFSEGEYFDDVPEFETYSSED